MSSKKEKKPFIIEFKSNYGTTTPTTSAPPPPTMLYCLHGQSQVHLQEHCHRQRTEGVDVTARKKLIIASILCLSFMVAEVVGGVLSNSLAIATDAAHLLTDFASFMISLFAIWLAGRPSTQRMSFGWYRAEVIGAVASVFMIWVITAILIWLAIQRILTQDYELDAKVMLITAGLAILVNVIMGFQLHHGHGHSHSHGGKSSKKPTLTVVASRKDFSEDSRATEISTSSDPSYIAGGSSPTESTKEDKDNKAPNGLQTTGEQTGSPASAESAVILQDVIVAAPKDNINVRAALIHVIGDAVQSVGVFIAALVIYFKPEWAIADPICTFVFSIIVLYTTFSIMKDALLVLMEGTPSYLDYAEVMNIFLAIEGVERVHNLRIWALSINKIALAVHLAISPGYNAKQILQDATNVVHLKYNFFETTIQIEDFTPEMEECTQCTVPDK